MPDLPRPYPAWLETAVFYQVYPQSFRLVEPFGRAHERGMHVCLDLVTGHTSIEHPWFRDPSRAVPGEFADRYIWTPSVWDRGDGSIPFVHGLADRDGRAAPVRLMEAAATRLLPGETCFRSRAGRRPTAKQTPPAPAGKRPPCG